VVCLEIKDPSLSVPLLRKGWLYRETLYLYSLILILKTGLSMCPIYPLALF
jgi:hypothetical protein